MENIIYKNYVIDLECYNYITVQFAGDDIIFETVEEAKKFIDEITK